MSKFADIAAKYEQSKAEAEQEITEREEAVKTEQKRTVIVGGDIKIYRVSQAIELKNTLAEPTIYIKNMSNADAKINIYAANIKN